MSNEQKKSRRKKWLLFVLRWGIAVVGIWYVLANISWHDRILVSDPETGWPVPHVLAARATDSDSTFKVYDQNHHVQTVTRDQVLVKEDPVRITVNENGKPTKFDVLAQKPLPNTDRSHWPYVVTTPRNLWQRYWNIHTGHVQVISPDQIVAPRPRGVPYPVIDQGIGEMVKSADRGLLLVAIVIFPVTFLITSYRWYLLLRALDICVSKFRALELNMVGAFYNTFLPGSTGGDVLKAYYAAKQTTHRTRAVMSVIVDRALGLLALVLLGGAMATYQSLRLAPTDPAKHRCIQIAIGSGIILLGTCVGLFIYYHPLLRKFTGLDFILRKLPMQRQVAKVIETMEIYRRRPGLILWSIIVTLPVHGTVILSTMFAGMAFHIDRLRPFDYAVIVPVIVLAGSIPISPQGAGVMEFFAIMLTRQQRVTISQAFAITMSIRIVQILWNLTGGIFVLRGGFHAPTETERESLETDQPEPVSVGS